jgi:nitroreductase
MELYDVMRTTAAVRAFRDQPVSDDMLYRILDHARFATNGSNHQPWRVIVVRDAEQRRHLRDEYVKGAKEAWAYLEAGLQPFAPPVAGAPWVPAIDPVKAHAVERTIPMADDLDKIPVLLLVCVELGKLAVTDLGLPRQSIVGGGSIYPFVHNILLAARNEGIGGLLATLVCRQEAELRDVFGIPDTHAVAAAVMLGHPVKVMTKLSRRPVEQFACFDRFDGPAFERPPPQG